MAIDPVSALGIIVNAGLTEIARSVRTKMERVLEELGNGHDVV